MGWETRRERIIRLLATEGFRADIDGDGDIRFKYEGGSYFICNTDDDCYFQMLYPGFRRIGSGKELGIALLAASQANRTTKVAKVYANRDCDKLAATAEIYCTSWEQLTSATVLRCLRCIRTAVETFQEEFRRLSS